MADAMGSTEKVATVSPLFTIAEGNGARAGSPAPVAYHGHRLTSSEPLRTRRRFPPTRTGLCAWTSALSATSARASSSDAVLPTRATSTDISTRGFAEWTGIFGDPVVATALLDRVQHHAGLIPEHIRANASIMPPRPRHRVHPRKEAASRD